MVFRTDTEARCRMERTLLPVNRRPFQFTSDHSRVITRPFHQSHERCRKIVGRVMALTDAEVADRLGHTLADFGTRHRDIKRVFRGHFNQAMDRCDPLGTISDERQLLIGSYFTLEYSVEAAALFNPSIVPAPDQSGLKPGHVRVILSFRATGEGHVSSIEFRQAQLTPEGGVILSPICEYPETPEVTQAIFCERDTLHAKIRAEVAAAGIPELPTLAPVREEMVARIPECANLGLLDVIEADIRSSGRYDPEELERIFACVNRVARSNYMVQFAPYTCMSDRILFPVAESERRGIEDARFVRLDHDGGPEYYATYTAFDGSHAQTQLLQTHDFLSFRIGTMAGRHANTKGMALFPRKIDGRYAMISRVDGENLFLMYSDDIRGWDDAEQIIEPEQPWEFVQMGNCGSPIETDAGWLLLTHGVGPMRRYCIGAVLLDRDDPSKVIARPTLPLIAPDESEREGYVPNVVYSCGAMVHNGRLVIPYAMSDTASGVATVPLDELLEKMT
jgi:predicted GH43/DUF377 family glycosyl hydrolase